MSTGQFEMCNDGPRTWAAVMLVLTCPMLAARVLLLHQLLLKEARAAQVGWRGDSGMGMAMDLWLGLWLWINGSGHS